MTTENQITVSVTGKNRVDLVKHLRAFADNLDGSPLEEKTTRKTRTTINTDQAGEDFETKKTATGTKRAAATFDEDEETEVEETGTTTNEDDFVTTKKAKKVTVSEVNDACKARARAGGKKGREQVLSILKKKFKTESITEIDPGDYAAVIEAMAI
jgi:hypothetical protein